MSDTGRVYQFFSYLLYTIAKEMERKVANLPSLQEKTMQQTCIKGIVVNNRITNVLGKKIGTMCAKLKREKRKSGGFGVKRLTNKWRHQTYSVKLFYHELDNYCTENER